MRRALTLIELIITLALLVILAGATVYIFRAVLLSWSGGETRSGVSISLDAGVEKVVRDLRKAKQASASNNDEIRFTQDKTTFHIYYLYNASETYPPAFSGSSYALKKAALTGGINGTFTYGSGVIIMTEILPPPTSDLSISNNLITIDLSIRRKGETIRSRTQVRPRNL